MNYWRLSEMTSKAKNTQQTEPQLKARSHTKTERPKTVNHSAKRVNSTAETRSQRKQFLFTKETSVNMKVLAMSKGISMNEMVNDVIESYIRCEFKKHPEYETIASTILKAEK